MNNYMKLIGIKAKKSCENRLNTKKKNLLTAVTNNKNKDKFYFHKIKDQFPQALTPPVPIMIVQPSNQILKLKKAKLKWRIQL